MKQWIVPIEITVRTECLVEARSPGEARERASKGDWAEAFLSNGETRDWEVVGEPGLNE